MTESAVPRQSAAAAPSATAGASAHTAEEWAPEVDARLARVGVRMALIADLFFFAAWYFAFFYLRALNNNGYWMNGVSKPPVSIGIAVALLAIASAAVYTAGNRAEGPSASARLWSAAAALLLGSAGVALMAYQLWNLGFGVTDGGYPSVFTGLATVWMLHLAAAMMWLGTIAVQAWRGGDTLARPGAHAQFGYILAFLAAIGFLDFVILYLL